MTILKDKPRHASKLKASNLIAKKFPQWRQVLWQRLSDIKSPWLDYAATAALSGARPEELRKTTYKRIGDTLSITIEGAMVRNMVGQPWRTLILQNDSSSEFEHLFAKATEDSRLLEAPVGKNNAAAFSMALVRAGKQVLPKKSPPMTASVYRHAFASDLKADGLPRVKVAAALGHCVTKTQSKSGRAYVGKAGVRVLDIYCAREVKPTHSLRYLPME